MEYVNRDFYCISRSGRVAEQDGAEPERYAYSVTSMHPELLAMYSGLPESNADIEHGSIYVAGVLITDLGDGKALVDIMADVDARSPQLLPSIRIIPLLPFSSPADDQVREHVLQMASNLHQALEACK